MDDTINTKTLQKYASSSYYGQRIQYITVDAYGNIRVQTESHTKTFFMPNGDDILANVSGYSADYLICMLQDEEGINVSKY